MMGGTIVHQRNLGRAMREHLLVQFQAGNAAANPGMIFDRHLVPRRAVAKYDFKISPRSGHARIKPQCVAFTVKPKIDSRPARYIHPDEPVYHVQPPRPTCGGTE